jgi:membrane-associated protease RseP (regulator of RpoE activity)
MPTSDLSSNDSQPRSETPSADEDRSSSRPPPPPVKWRLNLALFGATVVTVFVAGESPGPYLSHAAIVRGAQFAGALMSILVAHELGHFVAARLHRVDASLPFFIPLPPPPVSPFGTMGAIIRMKSPIPTRRALLDIGASGPLAGLVLAIPLYAWGVAHSKIIPLEGGDYQQLGSSLLLRLLDRLWAPTIPPGHDVLLHPVAFAAWGAMLVTMINLLPVSQLDGGHVAYALFGPRQDRYARRVHHAVLAFFFVSLASYVLRDWRAGYGLIRFSRSVGNSLVWLVLFEMLAILGTLASRSMPHRERREGTMGTRTRLFVIAALIALAMLGEAFHRRAYQIVVWGTFGVVLALTLVMERRAGVLRPHDLLDHPPTGAAPLDLGRKAVAVLTLAMFALLFMPTPFEL